MNRKRIVIFMITAIMLLGIVGCSNHEESRENETKTSKEKASAIEVTEENEIFDGKKEMRSFMISEVLHKTEGNYIETYDLEKEKSKKILHLKGNFRITGTMDGEVSTAKEAKLEIADQCVFNDNRSEYRDKTNLGFNAFQNHIHSKDFKKPVSIEITVDNGFVWLVELGN